MTLKMLYPLKYLFQFLIDICGVDHPSRKRRFEVVYNLLSTRYNSRIRVRRSTFEGVNSAESRCALMPPAGNSYIRESDGRGFRRGCLM
ncbi:hypothetical protein DCAR_0832796 [Daucus carota subsp. sativus]|uniref:NADH:ubiquinone oxidoreductase 30kDa subunit domain-containing protein n=1 Tax=Daucus carota subsp. sativus TaxID=79200 RepID=A0AAF0XTY1_DAUCS|nr:hypothetical protein DCAR_0832796 [Daucus carota subsp. sativus]